MIKEYKIVHVDVSNLPRDLEKKVNKNIADKWIPQGTPFIKHSSICQAMIKKESKLKSFFKWLWSL